MNKQARVIYRPEHKEYRQWVERTGVRTPRYDLIEAIRELNADGIPASNQQIARLTNRLEQTVGHAVRIFAENGVIENVSQHKGRFDWRLTELGQELSLFVDDSRGVLAF